MNIACIKSSLLFAVAAMAAAACAYEVPIGGDFAETRPDGFPAAWCWFDENDAGGTLKPSAKLARGRAVVERGEAGNELHISCAEAGKGTFVRSRRIPGSAGDIVKVEVEVRGSGRAWIRWRYTATAA